MDNSINFRGAFLVRKASPELKEAIAPILGTKGKNKVIDNVMKEGDSLFISHKSQDISQKGFYKIKICKHKRNKL